MNSNYKFASKYPVILRILLLLVIFLAVACGDNNNSGTSGSSGSTYKGTKNLTLDGVSADSVTLSWDALLNDEGIQEAGMTYQVSAWNNGMVVVSNVVDSDPLIFIYSNSLRGLSSDTAYQITVEAINSMGKSRAKSSLWAVPSGKAFSGLTLEEKLANISEAVVVSDTEMEVTWDETSSAAVYAIITAEDQADLFGGLEEVKKDKKVKIVCKSGLSGSKCPEFSKNADGKITNRVSDLNPDGGYTTMVLPFTFQDLAGLKMSDEEGKEIVFVDAVKNLLEKKDSTAFSQAKDVVTGIGANNQGVIDKIRVLWMSSREVGQVGNLSAVSYNDQVHVSWDHAAGANRYEAVLSNSFKMVTNTVDRHDVSQLSGGRAVFTNVGLGKYTVSVLPYFENNSGARVRTGTIVQISGERKADDPVFNTSNQVTGLKVTNHAPGAVTLSWSTEETADLTSYYIYYYQGNTVPDHPNYQAKKGETNNLLIENIEPGSYTIRVDAVVNTVIIKGAAVSNNIYVTPDAPKLVNPSPIAITNISAKLYHTAYGYTVLEGEAGGPTNNNTRTSVTASYRVESGEWKDTAIISGRAVFGEDEADVVSSYGKGYEVKVTVKNPGGFESSTTKSFVFRSFPEPIMGSKVMIMPDDRRLLVTWPESDNTNSSKVASYNVVVTDGDVLDLSAVVYGMTNVIGRSVVLDNLTNGKLYTVNVFPVSAEGWSLLSALGQRYNYPNIAASDTTAVTGIFGSYVGFPAQARPIGKPELVESLTVKTTSRSATDGAVMITWQASAIGSPADNYVVEYLKDVKPVLVVGVNNTVAVTDLDWSQPKSMAVKTNSNPTNRSYMLGITGLNTLGATNVFRVKAENEKGDRGYEHFVLGTDLTTPPSPVKNIVFSSHKTNSFTVTWVEPDNGGRDTNEVAQSVTGYRVSWKKKGASAYEGTNDLGETVFTYVVTGLKPGTEYEVLVQAKNNANVNGLALYNAGVSKNVWTPSVPGGVGNITYSAWEADRDGTAGFMVRWDAPTVFGKKNDGSGDSYAASDLTYTVEVYDATSVLETTYLVTGTNQAITGLSAGSRYSVTVTSSNAVGAGITVSGATNFTPSVPGAVTGLTPGNYKTDGFTLSWIAPGDTGTNNDGSGGAAAMTGYKVAYRVGNTGDYLTNIISSGTSYTFSGLASGTGYEVQVIAINAAGEGEIHSTTRVWTGSLPGDVGTVTGIARGANIVVNWSNATPGKAGNMDDGSGSGTDATNYYVVEYKNNTAGSGYQIFTNTSSTNARIDNLVLNNKYKVKVTVSNQHGLSKPVETAEIEIIATEKSAPPDPIILVSADQDSIVLGWSVPRDTGADNDGNEFRLTGYTLQYSTNNVDWMILTNAGNGVKLTVAPITTTNAKLIGLTDKTTYYFRVAGVTIFGTGKATEPFTVDYTLATGVTITPSPLNLVVGATREVTAALTPANAINTDFKWTSSAPGVAVVSDNGNDSATVTMIASGTATIWVVSGNVSNSVVIRDLLPPANFRQTSDKPTEIDLAWDVLSGITYHLFQIEDDGTTNSLPDPTGSTHTVSSLTANTYYRFLVKACDGSICSDPAYLLAVTSPSSPNNLAAIITAGQIPANLNTYNQLAQDIFSVYASGTTVVARYVLPGGTGDGSSWSKAAGSLKTVLEGITYPSANKVYAVLLGPGVYYAGAEMAMKNYVTIAGGISLRNTATVNAALVGATVLNGNNRYRVFYNDNYQQNPLTHTARLYGVTIADGYISGTGLNGSGGGMYNYNYSSPVLTRVIFTNNTANWNGGGMYNESSSSPILTQVTFAGNTATKNGGGMYNGSSSPVLTGVVFTGNTANQSGGGMLNLSSSPVLTKVVFSGNTANQSGGGMYNNNSFPILTGAVFTGNRATEDGGGMYNNNSFPILTGAVFTGNTAKYGREMYNLSSTSTAVNTIFWGQNIYNIGGGSVDYYYSVVQGGTYDTTNNIVTTDPGLGPLADNGGGIPTMAIPEDSSARDKGIFVKRKGSTHYYSIDNSTWYDTPKLGNDGDGAINLPTDAIDLTATDMRGKPVNSQPDIGVYEVQ